MISSRLVTCISCANYLFTTVNITQSFCDPVFCRSVLFADLAKTLGTRESLRWRCAANLPTFWMHSVGPFPQANCKVGGTGCDITKGPHGQLRFVLLRRFQRALLAGHACERTQCITTGSDCASIVSGISARNRACSADATSAVVVPAPVQLLTSRPQPWPVNSSS
jgi:hypothetical protein